MKTKPRIKHLDFRKSRMLHSIIFLLPWIIGFLLFFAKPLYDSLIYSLHTVEVGEFGGINMRFVGFDNYINMFQTEVSSTSKQFLRVFIDENARIFVNMPVVVVFSLFSAIIVNVKFKGRSAARVIFFLPIVIGLPVVLKLISVTSGGDIVDSSINAMFSGSVVSELLLENTFLPTEIIIFITNIAENVFTLISNCGVQTLIFLAGLQSISGSLYEAAKIEGANAYETFWKITLPMLSNIISFVIVYTFVDLFLSSEITDEIYMYAFSRNNIGMGSALGMAYLVNVIIDLLVVVVLFNKVVNRKHAR